MEWISFDEALPDYGKVVLVWFPESKHVEDARIYQQEDGKGWDCVLFDGESLNSPPSHWATLTPPAPEPIESAESKSESANEAEFTKRFLEAYRRGQSIGVKVESADIPAAPLDNDE